MTFLLILPFFKKDVRGENSKEYWTDGCSKRCEENQGLECVSQKGKQLHAVVFVGKSSLFGERFKKKKKTSIIIQYFLVSKTVIQ